jgi:hypothetical protein
MILNLLLVAGVASMLVDGGEQGSASKPRPGAQIS